jgi:hypothetical protein
MPSMYFDMGRVDDDIVLMVVVIPNDNNDTDYEDETRDGDVEITLTFGV